MIPPFVVTAARFALHNWKLALIGVLLVTTGLLKLSLAGERRHSARIQQRLTETAATFERFKAEVAARTALARTQDEAHARRVERDQILVSQETLSAYQKQIAALRARAAQRLHGAAAAADPGRGRDARMPGFSHAAGGTDGAAGEDRLPDNDALIASEIALRLKALQEWVRRQEKVER